MLDNNFETQVADLAVRYGQPLRVTAGLHGKPFSPLNKSNRIGEVCMVIRRKDGRLITAVKTFYPPGAFRLLTGGIKRREMIEAALLRETWEETGLDVVVKQFLAVIEYRLEHTERVPDAQPDFVTFAFLLDEQGGELVPQDLDEQLGEFREIDVAELPAVAAHLDSLANEYSQDLDGDWQEWGRFRAVVHRVVYDVLSEA